MNADATVPVVGELAPKRTERKPAREERSDYLDLVRGYAACAVVFEHIRLIWFINPNKAGHLSVFEKVFYALTGLGHQAVLAFFVLSGAAIGPAVWRDCRAASFSWNKYMTKRFARLWAVVIPALLLTWAVDAFGHSLAPLLYEKAIAAHQVPIVQRSNATTFIGNVLFLQTYYLPIFGSNSPFWSLAAEFWFYVAFPLLALAAVLRHRRWRAPIMIVLIAAILTIFGKQFVAGLAIWVTGAAAMLIPSPKSGWAAWAAAGGFAFCALLAIVMKSSFYGSHQIPTDFGFGCAFALTLWASRDAQFHSVLARLSDSLRARFFASYSFSVYAVHFPVILLAAAAFHHFQNLRPTLQGMWDALLLFFGAMVVARGFYLLFEANTPYLRALLMRPIPFWRNSRRTQTCSRICSQSMPSRS